MGYSIKSAISFGLVYFPVSLTTAVRNLDVGFNLIDKNTKSRISYVKSCRDCDGKAVKNEDVIKGFEYEKDKYVLFDDEELEKLKSPKDKSISIEKFVDISEVDTVFFDKSYYVSPQGGEKAFSLLLTAMKETNKAAVARSVLGSKESVIVLREREGNMILNTLHFYDEIQAAPAAKVIKPDEKELTLAKTLIDGMSGEFKPDEFKDEYRQRVLDAIQKKVEGKEIIVPNGEAKRDVAGLMDALEQSVKIMSHNKPAKTGQKPLPEKKRQSMSAKSR